MLWTEGLHVQVSRARRAGRASCLLQQLPLVKPERKQKTKANMLLGSQ